MPLATYKGKPAGSFGIISCFSFDEEKHIYAPPGGIVVTSSKELADKIRKFAWDRGAITKPNYGRVHTSFGLNYRFSTLNAALALAQIKILPELNQKRRELGRLLTEKIKDIPGVIPLYIPPGCDHVYWLYPLILEIERFKVDIWQIARAMEAEGLKGISPAPYYLIPESHTYFKDRFHLYGQTDCPFNCPLFKRKIYYRPSDLPNAKRLIERTLRWVWTEKYQKKDIEDIAKIIEKVLKFYHR